VTCIACNLREMAADSLVQIEGNGHYFACKMIRLEDGSIAGGAGKGNGAELLMDWLAQGGLRGNEPEFKDPDFFVLQLKRDGIYLYADSCIPEKLKDKNFAIGSGSDYAKLAMRHPKLKMSPAGAVREAIKHDRSCGGGVDVMRLGRRKP
jgi:hypothetical protein